MEPLNLTRLFRSMCVGYEMRPMRLHEFRHTCASPLVVHPRIVMEIVGHTTSRCPWTSGTQTSRCNGGRLTALTANHRHDDATRSRSASGSATIWFTRGVTDARDGLDNAERLACRVAERVTGATARAWDIEGRNGVVDAFLDYADGRTCAFEVTSGGHLHR
jgi:hypothetical protein